MTENQPSTPIKKRVIPKARLVIIESVYHQEIGKQPTTIPTRSSTRWLDTDEQPYTRHMPIGEEWVAIDTGWIEKACLCIITNEYKPKHIGHSGPTEEQKAEIHKASVEVSIRGDQYVDCILQPGESIRIPSPTSFRNIKVRGRLPQIKCLITLLPE